MRKRMWIAAMAAVLLLGSGWLLFFRTHTIRVPDRLPPGFPEQGFSHAAFEQLLERFVTPAGKLRYQAWHDDAAALESLDRYLAALARYSPKNAPDRFATKADRLAYWLSAYNACVIKAVLAHWPIGSVHDVKAPIELKAGMGFFWRTHFVIGQERINLYDLEHTVIRKDFADPRIHFALNCGSQGCPVLQPDLPTGEELEAFLRKATSDFLEDPSNVAIDHEARTVTLSAILDWYGEDFLADLARRGVPPSKRSLVAWLGLAAEGPLQAELERAQAYAVRFASYDWSVNAASSR